jgi:hypothetical protein
VEHRAAAVGGGERAVPDEHDRADGRPREAAEPPDEVADVQSFFSEHQIPQSAKTLDQILERQRVNAALREREQARCAAALTS